MDLQEFDFDVQFRKGVNNQNADALSRLPFQDIEEQTSTKEQPISNLEVPIQVSVRDTLLKPQDGTEIVDLVPSPETFVFTSYSAETPVFSTETVKAQTEIDPNIPVFSTDAVPAKISTSHLTELIATDTHPEPGDEPFVSSLNAQTAQHEWLKVSFEFGPPLIAAMDQDTEVNIPNHEVEAEDEQQLQLFEKQKLCPDFTHIIKYLETNEIPDDQNLAKSVRAESEYYDINEGVLIHFHQSRWKKLPPAARDIVQTWIYVLKQCRPIMMTMAILASKRLIHKCL